MSDFVNFARSHGIDIQDLYASEKIIRCPTFEHPRSKNASYLFDGKGGWVINWERSDETIFFGSNKEFTQEEKRKWAEKKRLFEAERQERARKAILTAKETIERCKQSEHSYLKNKGLAGVLGLVDKDVLIVPMYSFDKKLTGMQSIYFDDEERSWKKKFLYGSVTQGSVFLIGSASAQISVLCEGYATGITIKKAIERIGINANVVVCFSSHNLVTVAKSMKNKAFVFADNDKSGAGEASAKSTGLKYCMSDEIGQDANDMFAKSGLTAVCRKIMGVMAR
jgi:putative DNA primase/helicase